MSKVEVKVQFETITPLWTGDAWMENNEIRPSSLIGSLRFWFEVYYKVCKNENFEINENGIPKEKLDYEEFKKKVYEELLNKDEVFNSFEEIEDKILKNLGISTPSRVFGCTCWKSRVRIKDINFETEILDENKINNDFLINTCFWIKRSLFNNNSNINVHKNVKFNISVNEYWFCNYLKEFFDFYSDRVILVGGKKSFGFGFIKITYESSLNCNSSHINCSNFSNHYYYHEINYSPAKNQNKNLILGFNFRYYLRKIENREDRKRIFGDQGKASSIYISNFNPASDKELKLVIIKNPFDDSTFTKSINEIAEKLKNELINTLQNGGNR